MTGGVITTWYFNCEYLTGQITLGELSYVFYCSYSIFDVDDDTIPEEFRNGFTFLTADEQVIPNS